MPRTTRKKAAAPTGRRAALREVDKLFEDFAPARDVLRNVRAVPTVFAQFDHATGVGGFPTERIALMHGPSNEGKTLASLGFLSSFLAREHFAMLVDAEWTTPFDWVQKILGPHAESKRFFSIRPKTFEETRETVSAFLRKLQKARGEGLVPGDTSALVVVDSIRKLVPEKLMEKLLKDEGGIDGMGGRGAMHKAALNSQWMDELVPLLGDSGGSMLILARETEDPDADPWSRRFGNNYKVGGGKALVFDSSLVLRVQRAGWVTKSKEDKTVYGERHRITIRKTKIAGKDDRTVQCYFHSSNGNLIPEGLDRARDLVELGVRLGVVKEAGNGRLAWRGRPVWRNEHAAVEDLMEKQQELDEMALEVRERFAAAKPIEFDEQTGEVA